ncbi:hypothetical protein [Paraburkholderia solisilvae]|uniref:hypothetical protein n=1 Tax=Paraburkholderia solisilvae TaxID=624376 RepID=UPI0015816D82|nr:hypothetical protein [Paraburkholderia solisilvae]
MAIFNWPEAAFSIKTFADLHVVFFAISIAHAANCSSSGGEYNNSGGACTVPPGPGAGRITATGSGAITANGVTVDVPFGTAAIAQNGGSILFGIDPAAGNSKIVERFSGAGGLIGLFATGGGSQISATGLVVNLPGSGNIMAEAANGALIDLESGTSISIQSGGGSQVLLATGTSSRITANNITISGSTGGGDFGVHSTLGASIALADSSVTLSSPGGGLTGILAENGSSLTASGTTINISASGNNVAVKSASGSTVQLSGGSVTMTGTSGETALMAQGAALSANDVAIGVTGGQSSAGTVQNGGTMSISGGSVSATGSGSVGFFVNGSAGVANSLTRQYDREFNGGLLPRARRECEHQVDWHDRRRQQRCAVEHAGAVGHYIRRGTIYT